MPTFPSHPEAGPLTTFNIFSSTSTFGFFGDLGDGRRSARAPPTPRIDQEYGALGASVVRDRCSDTTSRAASSFLRTEVDGHEFGS